MAQETEVISCPACKHLLRVPLDWLGQNVQCPECKAMFKAPVKIGDKLSEPEVISRSPSAFNNGGKKFDVMLLILAFGLLFCGLVGVFVNGGFLYKLIVDRDGGHEWLKNQVIAMHKAGFGSTGAAEQSGQQNELDDRDAEQLGRLYRWILPISLVVSFGAFLGGLSVVLRWNYRLAQVGCLLAMLNIAHLCCIPGAVAGLWGILMLNSEEGRGHFGK